MGAQSNVHLHNVPSHNLLRSRTTLTASIWQIEGGSFFQLEKLLKQFLQTKTVTMTILIVDQMSEYCPDSEDVSANEENESDMEDDSFVLPPSKFSQDGETVSNDQEGNCFTTRIM